jgi:hypothetical protein
MTEEQINTLRNDFFTIIPSQFQTLYHGTNDLKFAVAMAQGHGWQSPQAFRTAYCSKSLGGTAIYGPGIYLADTLKEAKSYGVHVLEFTFKPAMDYLDLSDAAISKSVVRQTGGGKQTVLAEKNIDILIRVTKNYFVLRTPLLASVHMRAD